MRPTQRRSKRRMRCCKWPTMSEGRSRFLFAALVFLIAMLPHGAWAASAEAEIRNFIKQIYADSEIQVVFAQLPPGLRDTPRLKSISFAKVPDPSGDGICLVGIERS